MICDGSLHFFINTLSETNVEQSMDDKGKFCDDSECLELSK